MTIHALNAGFQNPPLLVETQSEGVQTEWQFLQENLPLSSLQFRDGKILARFFNPTGQEQPLTQPYQQTDVAGEPITISQTVPPKKIVTVALPEPLPAHSDGAGGPTIHMLTDLQWRVGENQARPDPQIIGELQAKIRRLAGQLAQLETQLQQTSGQERYFLEHRFYALKREMYEFRLSVRLNELKLAQQGQLNEAYLFTPDEEVATLGQQLNKLRIKRRIYDYIVAAVS
jgi:hypothetical protein